MSSLTCEYDATIPAVRLHHRMFANQSINQMYISTARVPYRLTVYSVIYEQVANMTNLRHRGHTASG